MKDLLKITVITAIFLFLSVGSILASEGTFELRSTGSNNYRCFAASLQMQNLTYNVAISCREIVFPLDTTIYSYILWANPSSGGSPVKIGNIGLGRAQFNTKTNFSSLFITGEQNPNVKVPTGNVIMKGSIKPITFLETETPTTTSSPGTEPVSPTSTPGPQTSLRDRILTGLKRAGLATGLALVAIFGLVFVLTRPK